MVLESPGKHTQKGPVKSWKMVLESPGKHTKRSWKVMENGPGKSWKTHTKRSWKDMENTQKCPGKTWKNTFSVLYAPCNALACAVDSSGPQPGGRIGRNKKDDTFL